MDGELIIEDIIVGEGTEAVKHSIVTVNYTGWLEDGSKFDSSLNSGREPLRFTVGAGQVIQGHIFAGILFPSLLCVFLFSSIIDIVHS